jgi:predicted lipoprotein with Yx(FWY)xxD motif
MRLSIKQSAMVALAVAVAALAIAACGGDDDDEASSGGGGGGGGVVSIQSVDGTEVLADSSGRTLYTADVEKGGKILCVDGCTSFWDPVAASADESAAAAAALGVELGVVKRPEGGRQLTYMGLPLYRFTDEGPGELSGDGFVDDFGGTRFEWLAAAPGGEAGSTGSEAPSSPY